MVRVRKSEQFLISVLLGRRFAPDADRGLHKAVLLIKICERGNPIDSRKRSKFLPDWSPENGTRVRSAPLRPGASPINMTRASTGPFNSVSTAARAHIAAQRTHLDASADRSRNCWCLFFSAMGLLMQDSGDGLRRPQPSR